MTTPPDDASYGLVMPFVVCATQGGPYDDLSFAAGWDCGALDAELAACRATGTVPPRRPVRVGAVPQIDLIAMRHGFAVTFTAPDGSSEWRHATFTHTPALED